MVLKSAMHSIPETAPWLPTLFPGSSQFLHILYWALPIEPTAHQHNNSHLSTRLYTSTRQQQCSDILSRTIFQRIFSRWIFLRKLKINFLVHTVHTLNAAVSVFTCNWLKWTRSEEFSIPSTRAVVKSLVRCRALASASDTCVCFSFTSVLNSCKYGKYELQGLKQ